MSPVAPLPQDFQGSLTPDNSSWLRVAADYYWDNFLTRFCYHLPLPLTLLFILALLTKSIGVEYGFSDLVYHDNFIKAMVNGFVLGLIGLQALYIGFILNAALLNPLEEHSKSGKTRKSLIQYSFLIAVCFVVTVLMIYFFVWLFAIYAYEDTRTTEREYYPKWSVVAVIVGMALAMLYAFLSWRMLYRLIVWYRRRKLGGQQWAERFQARRIELTRDDRAQSTVRTAQYYKMIVGLILAVFISILSGSAVAHYTRGYIGFAVTIVLLAIAVIILDSIFRESSNRMLRSLIKRSDALGSNRFMLLSAGLLYGIVTLGVFGVICWFDATSTAVPIGCTLLFVILSLYGFVIYAGSRVMPVIFTTLALLLLIGGSNAYKLRLADRQEYDIDAHQWTSFQGNGEEALEVRERLKEQLSLNEQLRPQFKPENGKHPIILIAVSGGGSRSADWTMAILNRLEKEFAEKGIDFPSRVYMITGASGGMFGASYYVATLPTQKQRLKLCQQKLARTEELNKRLGHLLQADFLTPITDRLVFNDIFAFFSPFHNKHDRGKALEEAWDRFFAKKSWNTNKSEGFQLTFAELQQLENKEGYPALVFSPMMVEDGRRLLISNLDLWNVSLNGGSGFPTDAGRFHTYSWESFGLFKLFPNIRSTFRLGTAARLSATFPFFSPAVTLPTEPRRRLVDAGYYDNYGVSLAGSWLFSKSTFKDIIEPSASGVLLIRINGDASEEYRKLERVDAAGDTPISRSIEELTTPLLALNNVRIAATSFRNDGLLELLSFYFLEKKHGGEMPENPACSFFTTVSFELERPTSVSWYLSRRDQRNILHSVDLNYDENHNVIPWDGHASDEDQREYEDYEDYREQLGKKMDFVLRWYDEHEDDDDWGHCDCRPWYLRPFNFGSKK